MLAKSSKKPHIINSIKRGLSFCGLQTNYFNRGLVFGPESNRVFLHLDDGYIESYRFYDDWKFRFLADNSKRVIEKMAKHKLIEL